MNIGLKIKQLRIKNNYTQNNLANMLGVSYQAISRWENNITTPDISILPLLSNLFNVTIDYLLDNNIEDNNDEINQIIKQYNELYNEEKYKECEILLEEYTKKYSNNYELKSYLINVYWALIYESDINDIYQTKLKSLCRYIINTCTIDKYRYEAISQLIGLYSYQDKKDKAISLTNKLPSFYETKDYELITLLNGVDRKKQVQENLESFSEILWTMLSSVLLQEEVGKRDKILLKYKQYLDMIYEDDNYGIFNYNISFMYKWCARDQAQVKNKEKTLEYLKLAIHYSKLLYKHIDNKEIIKHNSFLCNEIEDDPRTWNFSKDNICIKMIKKDIEENMYEFLKNDNDFIDLVASFINNE